MMLLVTTTVLAGCHDAGAHRFEKYCTNLPFVRNDFGYIELAALDSAEAQGLADSQAHRPVECLRLLTVLMLRHFAADVAVYHTSTFLEPEDHPCVTAFYDLSRAQRFEGGALSGDAYRWVLTDAPAHIAGDAEVQELVRRIQSEQKAHGKELLGDGVDDYELQPDGSWKKVRESAPVRNGVE
jgi:hypothetical protein